MLEETAHAKSVGDGLAIEIENKVASNVKGGYAPLPGTRNHVLLLAQLHPRPKGDGANKTGMWSSKRIIYGFYSEEVLKTGSSLDLGRSSPLRVTASALAKTRPKTRRRRAPSCSPGLLCVLELSCSLVQLRGMSIQLAGWPGCGGRMPRYTACAGNPPRGDGDPALCGFVEGQRVLAVDVARDEVY